MKPRTSISGSRLAQLVGDEGAGDQDAAAIEPTVGLGPAPRGGLLQAEDREADTGGDQHRAAVVDRDGLGLLCRLGLTIRTSATIATGMLIQKIERHVHSVR